MTQDSPWSSPSASFEAENDVPAWRRPTPFPRNQAFPPVERSYGQVPPAPLSPEPASGVPAPVPTPPGFVDADQAGFGEAKQPAENPPYVVRPAADRWADTRPRYSDLLAHLTPPGAEQARPPAPRMDQRPSDAGRDLGETTGSIAHEAGMTSRPTSLPPYDLPAPNSAPPYPYEGDLEDSRPAPAIQQRAAVPLVRPAAPAARRPEPDAPGYPQAAPADEQRAVRPSYDPSSFPRRISYDPAPAAEPAGYTPPGAYAAFGNRPPAGSGTSGQADPGPHELPQRVPAQPDVPRVPEPPLAEPTAETPALARIATHLRRGDVQPRERQEGFDVQAILAAVRGVDGVRDASLRSTETGAHSLRLDLAEGADPAEVSRRVARLLQDRMGLDAAMKGEGPLAPAPVSPSGRPRSGPPAHTATSPAPASAPPAPAASPASTPPAPAVSPASTPPAGYGSPASASGAGYGSPASASGAGYGSPASESRAGYGSPASGSPASGSPAGYGASASASPVTYGVPQPRAVSGPPAGHAAPGPSHAAPAPYPGAASDLPATHGTSTSQPGSVSDVPASQSEPAAHTAPSTAASAVPSPAAPASPAAPSSRAVSAPPAYPGASAAPTSSASFGGSATSAAPSPVERRPDDPLRRDPLPGEPPAGDRFRENPLSDDRLRENPLGAGAARADAARADAARAGAARADAARADAARADAARADAARADAARADAARADAARAESLLTEPARSEPESSRAEIQTESSRGESPRSETSRAEQPRAETSAGSAASHPAADVVPADQARPPRPLYPAATPGPRIVIENVHVNTFGTDATVEVRLGMGGHSTSGTASGPAVDGYLLRLCATATAGAVDELLATSEHPDGPARCFVEHAAAVPFGNSQVAVVVLLLSCNGWVEQLAGSAVVTGDDRHAMVRATLAAVNRRLEALLSR
ncbi:hypothetical protein ACQP2F_03365 [Actinoplanes sp. CA-030573]|uniref:hypothetical protein n=1 Tax=Actinoplanes sp. CA-030573 TaxID=3239898 RepID=UPI003D930FC7